MTPGHAPTPPKIHEAFVATDATTPAIPASAAARQRNDIPKRQNGPSALDWLAARHDRYRRGQMTWGTQVVLVVLVPAALTVLQTLFPSMQRWASGYGTVILCLDVWLDGLQDRFRRDGALVQEQFDRSLYGLPWPQASLGEPPSVNDVTLWARRGRAAASEAEQADWVNWYSPVLGRLPLTVARIACQHANGWWDATQRRTYAGALRVVAWLLPLALLVVSLARDLRVGAAFNALLTLAPIFVWCWREASRHKETADARERVMHRASEALRLAGAGASDEQLTAEATDLQRAILEQRRRAPAFPARLYKRLRGEYEIAMHAAAETVVTEYEEAERSRGAEDGR